MDVATHPTVRKININSITNGKSLIQYTHICLYAASHITSVPECDSKMSFMLGGRAFPDSHI